MEDTYKTIYKGDYLWPYIVPIQFKPKKPPEAKSPSKKTIKDEDIIDKELCDCANHSWSPHFQRARYLKEKELAFREAMLSLAHQRTILENEILEHPCTDSEDVVASLYKLNYAKKQFPVTEYRQMKADHDDPVVTPVAMPRNPQKSTYRDPSVFRSVAIIRPAIHSPLAITFIDDVAEHKFRDPTRSEYEDQISANAKTNERALQMFKETEYSSRR